MKLLDDIARYATLLAVLVAATSVVITVRQWKRGQTLTVAAALVEMIQQPDFTRATVRILELPVNAEPKLVKSDLELTTAAYLVSHVFESLGVMVFYRLMPLHLVDHLIGGYVRGCWLRLGPHIKDQRAVLGVMFGEWFQWLAERLVETPAPGKELGAPHAHLSWRA